MEGWTCVYTSDKLHEAEFVTALLDTNNITSVIVNKQDSLYLLGYIEVYVPVENAFIASQIINNLKSE